MRQTELLTMQVTANVRCKVVSEEESQTCEVVTCMIVKTTPEISLMLLVANYCRHPLTSGSIDTI